MGQGYSFTCKKCGKEHQIFLGVGKKYFITCKKIKRDIQKGKYGKEWEKLFKCDMTVDAENKLYVCGKCKNWVVEPDLSLYKPKVKKSLAEILSEICMPSYLDKEEYTLVKEYEHRCKKCGNVMECHDISGYKLPDMKCPDCGGDFNTMIGEIFWD
ncbi:MAG: hypothetical protein J6332_02055 [Abditibacteriota bacterium]|nr:hypothetical protein [Abditibacteriota bacterium]